MGLYVYYTFVRLAGNDALVHSTAAGARDASRVAKHVRPTTNVDRQVLVVVHICSVASPTLVRSFNEFDCIFSVREALSPATASHYSRSFTSRPPTPTPRTVSTRTDSSPFRLLQDPLNDAVPAGAAVHWHPVMTLVVVGGAVGAGRRRR